MKLLKAYGSILFRNLLLFSLAHAFTMVDKIAEMVYDDVLTWSLNLILVI